MPYSNMETINKFNADIWFNRQFDDDEISFFDEQNSCFDEEISSFRIKAISTDSSYKEMTDYDLLVETKDEKEKRDKIEAEILSDIIQSDYDREKRIEKLIDRYTIEIPIEEEKERQTKKKDITNERDKKRIQRACDLYAKKQKKIAKEKIAKEKAAITKAKKAIATTKDKKAIAKAKREMIGAQKEIAIIEIIQKKGMFPRYL